MAGSGAFDKGRAKETAQRKYHRRCDYRAVTTFSNGSKEVVAVNCRICLGRPKGYSATGRPVYSGGTVLVCDEKRPQAAMQDGSPRPNSTARCSCFIGDRKAGLAVYTDFPETHRFPEGSSESVAVTRNTERIG